uniref:Uncharacterized protein n=1 Tax=Rhizophora mucronata TaxID=61149 RepID=A0A2P2PL59_RHIMU
MFLSSGIYLLQLVRLMLLKCQ